LKGLGQPIWVVFLGENEGSFLNVVNSN